MGWLIELDQDLLLLLNGLHFPALDDLMYFISRKWVWLPVYAALLYGLYRLLGWKRLLLAAGLVVPLILLADQAASGLLKPLVARPRPCHDPEIGALVHRVANKCGGPYGFVSSHAANFFALATYLSFFFRRSWSGWPAVFFSVAAVVALSRVFLGVHYPGDVLGGAFVGIAAGCLCRFFYGKALPVLGIYSPTK